MKISLNWIGDFVDLGGIEPQEVFNLLSMHTAEVEGIEVFGEAISDVVVGEVVQCGQHPDADKLSVTEVAYGADEYAQVVCGAPNVRKGLKVAFAPVGAKLPGDFKIKKAKLRGVISMGMICSERELELSESHSGIMELPVDAPVGAKLVDYLGIIDHVLELDNKSLTHRPDLWGHYGFAREIAALLGRELKDLELCTQWPESNSSFEIKLADTSACPKYLGVEIDLGSKPRDSSDFIQRRLLAIGQRPINDVVDLSNYVLHEIGQPTHAFDRAKLASSQIIVRKATAGESLRTLDDVERALDSEDLLITDSSRPLAMAGIMGGADSEVDENSESIFLESACFEAVGVRRTSSRHALRSDASARFEKTLDPSYAEQAVARFACLLSRERPEAQILSKPVCAGHFAAPEITLEVSVSRTAKLLSLDLSGARMLELLSSIGFECTLSQDVLQAKVPAWRSSKDVTSNIDLVEEIGRLAGYHSIAAIPPVWPVVAPQQDPLRLLTRRLEDRVAGAWRGQQTESYSFLDKVWLERLGLANDQMLQLSNPVQDGVCLIRTDPVPSLIEQALVNLRERKRGLLFETAKGYTPSGDAGEPQQNSYFAALMWRKSGNACDGPASLFGQGRSLAEDLLRLCALTPEFGGDGLEDFKWAHPNRMLSVKAVGSAVGVCAHVDPRIIEGCGAEDVDFVVVMLDLVALNSASANSRAVNKFNIPSKMPAIKVDIALALPETVSFQEVEAILLKCGGKVLESLNLFDIFKGGSLEDGWRSLAFHACLRASDRTLSEKDEQKFLKKVAKTAEKLGGSLRS